MSTPGEGIDCHMPGEIFIGWSGLLPVLIISSEFSQVLPTKFKQITWHTSKVGKYVVGASKY